MKRVLTGIKPTGYAHIGNYFGAIKPAIEMSQNSDYDCYYFLADYHALTTLKTADELRDYTYKLAATWLACGLDENKVTFYRQSDIPEVFELNWILSNVTSKGLMNRAHAYKAIVEKNAEAGADTDFGVNMGLYNYPILMAADILLFNTNLVPVGLDQKQHIEIARDIANSFNNKYGSVFIEPEELIDENVCTLVGLDGRKMSKSYGNTIPLFGSESELKKSINRIITDSTLPCEPKSLDSTVNKLYKLFASEKEANEFEQLLSGGLSWGDAKKMLFEVANSYLSPMREKYNYYITHTEEIDAILTRGAKKAREVAQKNILSVRKAVGV